MTSSTLTSLLSCSPTKFGFWEFPETRLPMLPNPREIHLKRKKDCFFESLKTQVKTNPSHPLTFEPPPKLHDEDNNVAGGLGIVDFFHGKNIFITGATGLLGKVLVEKMLRSTPVGKVYVLIKAKDKEEALDRVEKEIIKSELFECLREKHDESFMREKLIPVLGNISEPNLGMDVDCTCADDIRNNVDIIIHSAASTTLNDRYDWLLDANVDAPQRVMRFAKSCTKLKLFAHISTAYVNGKTEGVVLEEPLKIGTFPRLDVADEINMATKSRNASTDVEVTKNLKRLGQERAAFLGWHNAYTLTKAMGEMVLDEIRGDVPMVIIRPTIIESSYKGPLPGWIQGNRMCDPVIIAYGKGQFPAFLGNPNVIMDVIPVDMVVNTTIAAIAKEGQRISYNNIIHKPHELNVYHVASSVVNPLRYSDFYEYLYEYFSVSPLIEESQSIARIEYFDSINDLSRYTLEEFYRGGRSVITSDEGMIRRIRIQCKAKAAYAEQLCRMYEFIGFFNARFDTGNTEKLMKEMSREERDEFEVNARSINWRHYLQNVHIPGLKKHVLNDTI